MVLGVIGKGSHPCNGGHDPTWTWESRLSRMAARCHVLESLQAFGHHDLDKLAYGTSIRLRGK